MKKYIAAAVVVLAGVAVALPSTGEGARSQKLVIKPLDGPSIDVQPLTVTDVGDYDLRCPSGYRATGFGVGNGANSVVYADPDFDGRGYGFAFSNESDFSAYSARASIVCAKGSAGLRVRASADRGQRASAVADAKAALEK